MKFRIYILSFALLMAAVIGYAVRRGSNVAVGMNVTQTEMNPRVALRAGPSERTHLAGDGSSKIVRFDIHNEGDSAIMFPDGWYLQLKDGSFTMLSLPGTGNIRVEPGKTDTITITNAVVNQPWRLGASYYVEDVVFTVKVKVGLSPLGEHLPSSLSSVRGRNVVSDWIE